MKLLLLICTTLFSATGYAQNVGIGTPTPDASAQLEIASTTKGILIPRMTLVQRTAITNPLQGLLVYQIDGTSGFYVNRSTIPGIPNWSLVSEGTNYWLRSISSPNDISNTNAGNVGIGALTPKFPLTFADAIGNKISLFGGSTSTTTPHYGLGIQSGLMQFYTDNSGADFAFGYGNSNAFTQNMRIKGDGNISIGGPVWTSAANDRVIRFGDLDFVHIGEVGADDKMELKASAFSFGPGKVQIQDGSQGVGKAFVSDANGVGTWSPQAFTNTERFKVTGAEAIITGGGFADADFRTVLYNYSATIIINLAANSITFNKAGLYRFEFGVFGTSLFSENEMVGYLNVNNSIEYTQYTLMQKKGIEYKGSLHFTTDRYMPAGAVLKISLFQNSGTYDSNYLAGYLIAE